MAKDAVDLIKGSFHALLAALGTTLNAGKNRE